MIAKKEWFVRREFGWGLTPVTWQGWVYVAVIAAGILFILVWPGPGWLGPQASLRLFLAWIAILVVDTLHLWVQLGRKKS